MKSSSTIKSLLKEIPSVDITREGLISGGFLSIGLSNPREDRTNLNCPSEGSCSQHGEGYYVNVNCPSAIGASCSGSAPSSENFNCNVSNLCGQTTKSTIQDPNNGQIIYTCSMLF